MKKFLLPILLTCFAYILLINSLLANNSVNNSSNSFEIEDVCAFDEAEIYDAFSGINEVVSYLSVNETATYADVQKEDSTLLEQLNDNSDVAFSHSEKFSFNKQTAFLMGCVFGAIGILTVAIVNNGDKEPLNSSIWGCVTSGCIVGLPSLFFIFYYFYLFSGSYSYL